MAGRKSTTAAALKKANIKYWQWSISLFLLTLIYLVIGAFIFRATEEESSKRAQLNLYTEAYLFLLAHSCLSSTDLESFGGNMSNYLARGASVKSRYWIDTNAEEITSTWTMTRAFIFSLTIITTIGYGNIVPRTSLGRLFCVLYAMIGIPLMGFTLTVFGKSCDRFTKKYLKAMGLLKKYIKRGRPRQLVQSLVTIFLVVFFLILLPSLLVSYYENWAYFDSVYFFFITVSTIGFGDLVIEDCARCGRSVWIFVILYVFYVFVGICIISMAFTAFGNYQRRKLAQVESLVITFLKVKSYQVIHTAAVITGHSETNSRDDDSVADNEDTTDRQSDHDSDSGIVNFGHDLETVEFSADVHADLGTTYTFVQAQSS
ncbi:Potassium channel subfamily K member 4 [Holothuria leucospilota]|uniref:Potassium channel subfamily K member 4 n=1 Tax=Holothuria leucospilota TaxID=206669 RepID=A0A9Q1HCP8_HOLLE|nr:Potassium channel subfamily K member 4 [Holothuria leucospilota]